MAGDSSIAQVTKDLIESGDLYPGQKVVKFSLVTAGKKIIDRLTYYYLFIEDQNNNIYKIFVDSPKIAQQLLYEMDDNHFVVDAEATSAYRVRKSVGVMEYPSFIFRNNIEI